MEAATIKGKTLLSTVDHSKPSSDLTVSVQTVVEEQSSEEPPSANFLTMVARAAHSFVHTDETNSRGNKELTIRVVDALEMQNLNKRFRGKDKVTNVLSFTFDQDFEQHPNAQTPLLGDIVLCHSVIVNEAIEQAKTTTHHYAHMVTHGVLHLLGFDHEDEIHAEKMESLETAIMATIGFDNPYQSAN